MSDDRVEEPSSPLPDLQVGNGYAWNHASPEPTVFWPEGGERGGGVLYVAEEGLGGVCLPLRSPGSSPTLPRKFKEVKEVFPCF